MSLSPIANRSFLHGDRKPSPNSEKIVYATLDSLALKRARLPLQLLPIDANNATEKATKPKKKRNASGEAATKRSSFKVRVNSLFGETFSSFCFSVELL